MLIANEVKILQQITVAESSVVCSAAAKHLLRAAMHATRCQVQICCIAALQR